MSESWFKCGTAPGLRELKEQLIGLLEIKSDVSRASVLDLGCAEGLVGKYMIDTWGADLVHGIEIEPDRVEVAQRLCAGYINAFFMVGNLEDTAAVDKKLLPQYDVVLALAIVHKLKDPIAAIRWVGTKAKRLLVIRMPTASAAFRDPRSGMVKVSPIKTLSADFDLQTEVMGPRNELTLIFQRRPCSA